MILFERRIPRVSSLGIASPLVKRAHLQHFLGLDAELRVKEPIGGTCKF
jgi:ribosome maturation factor RimP